MNLTMIGMAGAGKSRVGALLAKRLGYAFVDTDQRLEAAHGEPLQALLDRLGDEAFIRAEAGTILALAGIDRAVIAPGGSIVYSEDAMRFLKRVSSVVWLYVPIDAIEARIDPSCRGIVGLKGRTFRELYAEREALYAAAADHVVAIRDLTEEAAAELVISALVAARIKL
ncbi:MAG: shikimate kinase [Patescibacteria group bacterium]